MEGEEGNSVLMLFLLSHFRLMLTKMLTKTQLCSAETTSFYTASPAFLNVAGI